MWLRPEPGGLLSPTHGDLRHLSMAEGRLCPSEKKSTQKSQGRVGTLAGSSFFTTTIHWEGRGAQMWCSSCLGPWLCRYMRFGSSFCIYLETLVVNCWPSSLIRMQVGFQASTSFLSQWMPWGERRSSRYGLIVWACRAVQVPRWGTMDSIDGVSLPAHAKANAYCCGQVRKSTGRHSQVGVQDQKWLPPDKTNLGHLRADYPQHIERPVCELGQILQC